MTRWTKWKGEAITENGHGVLTTTPPGDIGLAGIITRNKHGNPGLAGSNGVGDGHWEIDDVAILSSPLDTAAENS